ncbi:nucleotidyltransferase family protein [Herbaspirillum sp. DW155]|uniref:nucleotidyltransferase family protein n=1 Tax=Herbaspirillum sp. DW155 TaxID=3095609 RepID=UPI0030CF1652
MPTPTSPIALLLAAGRGSRFDAHAHKLLQPFVHHDGRAGIVATATAAALLEVMPVVAVVHEAGPLADALRQLGCTVCMPGAGEPREMSASLRCGLQQAADASGWLVALADMPRVQPSTLRRLRDALAGGASMVVPVMQGRRGNPAGFSREHWPELLALQGDRGARALLQGPALVEVAVEDEGIFADVDTPADLQRLRETLR